MSFNEIHPEIRDNEVFIGNCDVADIRHLKWWKTLRTGIFAYDSADKIILNHVPSFVQKEEWEYMNNDELDQMIPS